MLKLCGEKILVLGVLLQKLGRLPFLGDVARDRKQMRRTAPWATRALAAPIWRGNYVK
jgi:hypothetical protein